MYPDEVSPGGWMWRGVEEERREGRTVGTFEWLVSG